MLATSVESSWRCWSFIWHQCIRNILIMEELGEQRQASCCSSRQLLPFNSKCWICQRHSATKNSPNTPEDPASHLNRASVACARIFRNMQLTPLLTLWRCVPILSCHFNGVNTFGRTVSLQRTARTGIADVLGNLGMQSGRSKTTRHVICQDTRAAVLCKPPHRMSSTMRQWSKPARLKHAYHLCVSYIYIYRERETETYL